MENLWSPRNRRRILVGSYVGSEGLGDDLSVRTGAGGIGMHSIGSKKAFSGGDGAPIGDRGVGILGDDVGDNGIRTIPPGTRYVGIHDDDMSAWAQKCEYLAQGDFVDGSVIAEIDDHNRFELLFICEGCDDLKCFSFADADDSVKPDDMEVLCDCFACADHDGIADQECRF